MGLVAGEIFPARPSGDPKSLEGKKKKSCVSLTHGLRDPAEGLGGRPRWFALHRGFLPSSFFFSFLSSLVENQLLLGVNFFCAFFSFYVRCQLVSSGQKTQPFCHNRTEVILNKL
jgi:hypothetical protein